jgi:hypothetical protein
MAVCRRWESSCVSDSDLPFDERTGPVPTRDQNPLVARAGRPDRPSCAWHPSCYAERTRYVTLLAFWLLACASCESPTTPTATFGVVATSPPPGGTVSLPGAWPENTRVPAPTVTIQFKYFQSFSSASVIVDLMSGSNVCLQAEGLKLGPGYAVAEPYVGGSTVTVTGNNFEHNIGYPLCGTTSFSTDHLRFQLLAHYPPPSPGAPAISVAVVTQDVARGWTFSK